MTDHVWIATYSDGSPCSDVAAVFRSEEEATAYATRFGQYWGVEAHPIHATAADAIAADTASMSRHVTHEHQAHAAQPSTAAHEQEK
jgi:hypothetical protein